MYDKLNKLIKMILKHEGNDSILEINIKDYTTELNIEIRFATHLTTTTTPKQLFYGIIDYTNDKGFKENTLNETIEFHDTQSEEYYQNLK